MSKAAMNKTGLISAMAEKSGLSKTDSEKALNALLDIISDEMKSGGKVQLIGFGTFEVAERAAKEGRNPATGEAMTIPAGKVLKDAVNA